jgi:hypothetical protein
MAVMESPPFYLVFAVSTGAVWIAHAQINIDAARWVGDAVVYNADVGQHLNGIAKIKSAIANGFLAAIRRRPGLVMLAGHGSTPAMCTI